MAEEILTLKKREKLISPKKIICGGEFNSDQVNHGIEGEGRISHEGIEEVNPKKSNTITMFVKPPQSYGVEFEYIHKLGNIITNENRITNQWKPYLLNYISYNQRGFRKSRIDSLESSIGHLMIAKLGHNNEFEFCQELVLPLTLPNNLL